MKIFKSVLAGILCIIMVVQLGIIAYSAVTYYETTVDNIGVFSEPYKDSTKKRSLPLGTVVKAVSSKTNSYGNLWYKLDDGSWIYSGNVKVHKHVAVKCSDDKTSYKQNNDSTHIKIYKAFDELCSCNYVVVVGKTTNTTENHSFNSSGKCTKCGYVKKVTTTNAPQLSDYYETTVNNIGVFSLPYQDSQKINTLPLGTVVKVVSSQTNSYGNLWYKLDDGTWIYSGNVKVHKHVAVMCGPDKTSYEQWDVNSHEKTYYVGDNLCSCGAFVSKGKTTISIEGHTYSSGGKCTKCGYSKPVTTTHAHIAVMCGPDKTSYEQWDANSHEKTYYVGDNLCSCGAFVSKGKTTISIEGHTYSSSGKCTKCGYVKPVTTTNAPPLSKYYETTVNNIGVFSLPYQDSQKINTLPLGTVVKVVSSQTNSYDKVWYKLDDGTWIYSGNVKVHKHVAVKCNDDKTSYNQNNDFTHIKVFHESDGLCQCGYIVNPGSTTTTAEDHTYNSSGQCTKCGYMKVPTTTKHKHTAVKCSMDEISYEQYDDSFHIENYYSGDNLCSCGYVVSKGSTIRDFQEHSFNSSGFCKYCGYEGNIILDESPVDNQNYATLKDNVPVRVFCKENAAKAYTISKKGTSVKVSSLVVNQAGHIWAKTTDGYYIFLSHLEEVKEAVTSKPFNNNLLDACNGTEARKGKLVDSYYYNNNDKNTHCLIKTYEKVCTKCGKVIRANDNHSHSMQPSYVQPYITEITKHAHVFNSKDKCTQCGYCYKEFVEQQATISKISVALSALGLIPIVGNVADALDLAFSIATGDTTGASLAAVAMIPGVGLLAGSAKAADKIKDIEVGLRAVDNLKDLEKITKALEAGEDAASLIRNADNVDDMLIILKLSGKPGEAAMSARDVLLNTAENKSLKNVIEELYKPGSKYFDGGTADILKHEKLTGTFITGVSHENKAIERINNLNNIIKNQPNLSPRDRLIIDALKKDLQKSLDLGR